VAHEFAMSALRTSISLSTTAGFRYMRLLAPSYCRVFSLTRDGSRSTKHDLAEQQRRTRAARVPEVLDFLGRITCLFLITPGITLPRSH
jgi:hypothetical protein